MPFFDTFFKLQPTAFGQWLQVEKARRVLHRLQRQRERIERMLEIGAGWGELADLSIAAHIDYYAIEANEVRAKSLYERGVPVLIISTPPIPMQDGEFDAVVALNVLEHMPDLTSAVHFLSEMIRVTRPNGLICINCPDFLAAGKLFWDADYTHNFPITMRRLTQMYTDLGLDIVDATFFAGIVSGPLATPISWMAKLFPKELCSFFVSRVIPQEQIYRTQLTFIRNVFMIGRKY